MNTGTPIPNPRADELLAIRCQLGERAAFDALVARWHGPMWRYLRRLAGHDDAARDLMQDTWLRVFRGIASLREPAKLRPWLFGIARRVAMDRLRFEYARPTIGDAELESLAAPEMDLALDEDVAALDSGIAKLPAFEREALTLFYLRELSIDEIAGLLDTPVGTIKSRLFRARQFLRRELSIVRRKIMSPQNESLQHIHDLVKGETSLGRRIGYVALLLASATMTSVIVALWATEPTLPIRTHFAFGAMTVIGLSWVALAGWALTSRRVLFARDRVIAGRMAVTFTTVFVLGAFAMLIATGSAAAAGALGTGIVMVVIALGVWRQAHRRFAALHARRAELERELGAVEVCPRLLGNEECPH